LIYDLQRHPVPYYFITLMGKLTRLHPMVIHDGRISVARSLTRTEWLARIGEAGIARDGCGCAGSCSALSSGGCDDTGRNRHRRRRAGR